ncbi:glycosyl transferase [Shewanella sp. 10N.286.51.B7]|uniref:Glycosyltransferase family 25 protein n=1 Tax=Shewanella electrodiphila TaxID=934143 RepID=A0ABT0KUC5_9GAMM|nr:MULTISPECIES: glycosyltransferase family 25 protein [Shewanella]MCL1047363.1 glycosyltransferase family 25 protein [Shewanella electrodiphila]PMG78670.1 glycosyl transferase [Shewanella sp. 10N.286.51.B7]
MQFKVFVINLDKSTERMAFMHQQLEQLNIEYERVPAVYGKDLSETEVQAVFNESDNLAKYDKVLNVGEIGCYLSHINCWNMMVEQELDFALILEDDSVLNEELLSLINSISELCSSWDYIKLCHGRKQKAVIDTMKLTEQFSLSTCLKLPSSTRGQFVSISGAKKLLATATPITRPIDIDIQFWYEKALTCFVVRPYPVLEANFESEICNLGNRHTVQKHPFKRIWQKICFEKNVRLNKDKIPKLSSFL